jgi:crossover junction endodeoxyribonuclease RuvC
MKGDECMLVLGVDPGSAITGYGLVKQTGNKLEAVNFGCIRTSSSQCIEVRIKKIYDEIKNLIFNFKPDNFAVEELFFNKNVRTALTVAQARGVILLAGAENGLDVYEYTPLQVKQAVVGYGRAEKAQVQYMVKTILGLPEAPKPDDVADALAIAICHAHFFKSLSIIGGMK